MLREALDFPTSGDRGSAALLVGSVLLLLSVAATVGGSVFPALLAVGFTFQLAIRGYYVRVLRATAAEQEPVAPSFGDVTGLFRDGLAAVGIAVAYLLPALLLFLLAAGGNLASAVENPLQVRDPATVAALETVGSLAALLGLFSVLAALYLVPGAVTLYAHEGRVRSAFDLRTVLQGTFTEDYAVGWVLSLVLQTLLFPVVAVLYSLIVGVFLHFFLGVSVRYIWGTSLGNALKLGPPTVERVGITPDTSLGGGDDEAEAVPSRSRSTPDGRQQSSTSVARTRPLTDRSPDGSEAGDAATPDTPQPAIERVDGDGFGSSPEKVGETPDSSDASDEPSDRSPGGHATDPMAEESNR